MPATEHSYLERLPAWSSLSLSQENIEAHVFPFEQLPREHVALTGCLLYVCRTMTLVKWVVTHVAPVFIVTSPVTSYADQIWSMSKKRSSAGFSLDIPLIMLVASILKYVAVTDGTCYFRVAYTC